LCSFGGELEILLGSKVGIDRVIAEGVLVRADDVVDVGEAVGAPGHTAGPKVGGAS